MLPNLSGLLLSEPTGEFYQLTSDDARELRALGDGGRCALTLEFLPANASPEDEPDLATFRLPLPESAQKNSDGSYRYRVFNAKALWEWVRRPGHRTDPIDRTPLLRRDWEALRDQYSNAETDPNPPDHVFRRPITSGLWPPGVPYVPPPPPPPPTLMHSTLSQFVRTAVLRNNLGDLTIRSITRELERDQGIPEGGFQMYLTAVRDEVDFWLPIAMLFRVNAGIHDHSPLGIFDMPPPLDDDAISLAVRLAYDRGGPNYVHPTYGPIAGWDVSDVTNMDSLFGGVIPHEPPPGVIIYEEQRVSKIKFNGDLSRWNTHNVTSMEHMFWNATAFNGNLGRWDVRNVVNMNGMFRGATAFEGKGLSGWKFNRVTNMQSMFQSCEAFNADLSRWDVRNVTDMYGMFEGAVAYRPAHALGSRRLRLDAVSVASGSNALV